jgi:hypothetical protein
MIAFFGGIAHSALVYVFRLEPNAIIGLVICNLAIVWCFLLEMWYFGYPVLIWSGAGAISIKICSALISL